MSLVKTFYKSRVNSTISQEQNRFYRRHNHCSLCTHELSIDIQRSPNTLKVHEKVSCPNCNVTISTKEHDLN